MEKERRRVLGTEIRRV